MKAFMKMYILNQKSQGISKYNYARIQARRSAKQKTDIGVAVNLVAAIQGVSPEDILKPSRSQAHIALARQLAMYMAHVALGYSLTKTGQLFRRDRTTVSHACGRIEDMRDDVNFDHALDSLEAVLNFAATSKPEFVTRPVR